MIFGAEEVVHCESVVSGNHFIIDTPLANSARLQVNGEVGLSSVDIDDLYKLNIKKSLISIHIQAVNSEGKHELIRASDGGFKVKRIDSGLHHIELPLHLAFGEGGECNVGKDGAEENDHDDWAGGASVGAILGLLIISEQTGGAEEVTFEVELL